MIVVLKINGRKGDAFLPAGTTKWKVVRSWKKVTHNQESDHSFIHKIVQAPTHCGLDFRFSSRAAAMASSNVPFTLNCVRAEHSMYDDALIWVASLWPSDFDTIFFPSAFSALGLSLLSDCVPTKTIGVEGQCLFISLIHFVFTLSKDA